MAPNPILTFADWEIDEDRWQLRHGGVAVGIQPKPLAVLIYLARNRDRVVPRDELLTELWPGVRVTSSSLMRAVSLARRALGDSRSVIRTCSRRGYRLLAHVEERWWAPERDATNGAMRHAALPDGVRVGGLSILAAVR